MLFAVYFQPYKKINSYFGLQVKWILDSLSSLSVTCQAIPKRIMAIELRLSVWIKATEGQGLTANL